MKRKPGPKPKETIPMFKFRPGIKGEGGVVCSVHFRECEECGWNPKVEKQRIEEIKNGHPIYLRINPWILTVAGFNSYMKWHGIYGMQEDDQ